MTHSASPLRRSTFLFTAWLLATTAFSFPAMAFNPNEGAEAKSTSSSRESLPSIEPLLSRSRYSRSHSQPGAAVSLPSIDFQPLSPAPAVAFPKVDAAAIQSTFAPSVLIPTSPLPAPEVTPVARPETTMPMEVSPPTSVIAPVPPLAILPPPPPLPPVASAPQTVPAAAMPMVVTEAVSPLSRDSKAILSQVPSRIDTPKPEKSGKIAVSRVSPELQDLQVHGKVDTYQANGIQISVRRPGLDTNYELNRAYNAMAGGDSEIAIDIYKNILSVEPKNQDALFGLALLYHRQGKIENARSFYATLLKNHPNHREGLNNFLALVSEESPQEALAELERLEQRNPRFSAIPAQQAMLLNRLGYADQARVRMLRAIELSPNNLTYKYNLAVMLDKQGNFAEAADLYRLLIQAESRGEMIPAPVDHLQKRLNYIATAMVAGRPAS